MLSRANSGAGHRLRRAKSSSSSHHQRFEPEQVPIHPEHAEVAAVQAYRRAYRMAEQKSRNTTQCKHESGRIGQARRSEGSHFQDSRAGNRLGRSRAGTSSGAELKRNDVKDTHPMATVVRNGDEMRIITRPRKAIDTASRVEDKRPIHRPPQSPAPRPDHKSSQARQQTTATDHAITPARTRQPLSAATQIFANQRIESDRNAPPDALPETSTSLRGTNQKKAVARDKYLQESYTRRLQPKRSFIDPFKRRLSRSTSPGPYPSNFDRSVPPFNTAYDGFCTELPVQSSLVPTTVTLNQSRNVSDSLKSKFRKMFGRERRVQTALPAQHVSATQYHFNLGGDAANDAFAEGRVPSPDRPPPSPPLMSSSLSNSGSAQTYRNTSGSDAVKSRVTSWTNSTTSGTARPYVPSNRLSSINELPSRKRDLEADETHTAVLGRALRSTMSRRRSRTDVGRSSEESQRLYEVLRKQIQEGQSHDRASLDVAIDGASVPFEPPLPVQKAETYSRPDLHLPKGLSPVQTIRTVTPDQAQNSHSKGPSSESVQCTSTTPKFDGTTLEQRQRRYDRAERRWQSTLESESPVTSRALLQSERANPYRLYGCPTSPPDPHIPIAVRKGTRAEQDRETTPIARTERLQPSRCRVGSPSLYSRPSDASSTRPNTPLPNFGTVITITGREVQRYSLDSPIRPQRHESVGQSTADWQNWLSGQMSDFETDSVQKTTEVYREGLQTARSNESPADDVGASVEHVRDPAQLINGDHSERRIPDIRPPKTRRPKLDNRKSSGLMNDRYPILDSGRKTSDKGFKALQRSVSQKSMGALRRISSTSRRKAKGSDIQLDEHSTVIPSVQLAKQDDTSGSAHGLTHPKSLVQMTHRRGAQSVEHSVAVNRQGTCGTPIVREHVGEEEYGTKHSENRPKSALDLRARYKPSRASLRDASINIRRKPLGQTHEAQEPPFEDPTLQKISEGPYAFRPILSPITSPRPSPPTLSPQTCINKENTTPTSVTSIFALYNDSIKASNASLRAPSSRPSTSMGVNDSTDSLNLRSRKAPRTANSLRDLKAGKESPGQKMLDDFLTSRKATGGISPIGVKRGDRRPTGRASPAFL